MSSKIAFQSCLHMDFMVIGPLPQTTDQTSIHFLERFITYKKYCFLKFLLITFYYSFSQGTSDMDIGMTRGFVGSICVCS